ncbi:MAG: polyamine ABC transporter ATP-binding protein, partial [Thermoproteota archaeon]
VFQDLALFPHMTVLENVAFGPLARGVPREEAVERARRLLEMVRLEGLEERYPHQLSGGQQQRVALARALAVEPAVLLLDEPFGALDARLREELLWEVRRVHGEVGFTALHVTHDQAEALAVADRLAVLREGRIVRVGRVEEVVREPMDEFVARFLGANVLRGDAARALGVEVAAFYPEEVEPDPGGVEARVVAVSFSRSGYRVRATVDGQEVEVLWPGRPGERIRFRPRRLLRLTPR